LDIVEEGLYDLLKVFPEELKSKENCLKAFEKSIFSIYSMPNEFKTLEMCMKAYKNYIDLEYFLPEFITYDICKIYVKGFGQNIANIPNHFKTEEMCRIALTSGNYDGVVLNFIPDEMKTVELFDLAIRHTNGYAIQYIINPSQEQINLSLELSDYDSFLIGYLGIVMEVIPNDRLYSILPSSEEECPICREFENEGSKWCEMNGCETIQHSFHVRCVDAWWNSNDGIRKCPICRATAIEKNS
jgi:hypothetical protein